MQSDTARELRTPLREEWHLEGILGQGRTWSIPVRPLPFSIGRHDSCHLHLASQEVSRNHAEIIQRGGRLWIRDLGSTNGTFLNHERLNGEALLQKQDILHFGSVEFRVDFRETKLQAPVDAMSTGIFTSQQNLPDQFVRCSGEFEQMLRDGAVTAMFQPIVRVSDRHVIGFELLGRGDHPGLPTAPLELFSIAERLGKEVELSHLFRVKGISLAQGLGGGVELFVNNHPEEINRPDTLDAMRNLREMAPDTPLVVEIHEKTVTDLRAMRELRSVLRDLNIGLAYDDFGAGQARLLELIEVPPDYLKFDAFLVRDVHRQPERFRRALAVLVQMARELGVVPLAEGVESEGEAVACQEIGFEAAQGFYFGRPAPLG